MVGPLQGFIARDRGEDMFSYELEIAVQGCLLKMKHYSAKASAC